MIFTVSLMLGALAVVFTVVLSPELRAAADLPFVATVIESAGADNIPAVARVVARGEPVVRAARFTPTNTRSTTEQPRPRASSEAAVSPSRTTEAAVERKRTAVNYGIYVPPF
ncbi:MAG: hypothetical protein ABL901_00290 [Hyphomicrobiaceae bacterium]